MGIWFYGAANFIKKQVLYNFILQKHCYFLTPREQQSRITEHVAEAVF